LNKEACGVLPPGVVQYPLDAMASEQAGILG
jgi:hypothetical protein